MNGPLKKSKQRIEQDYARNAIADYESGNKKAAKYEKKRELEVAAGEGPKMMDKSPTKMKYESASQETYNLLSMNPLSKHMSTPPNMYRNSPAQMANSAMKMADKSAMKMADKSAMKMSDKSAMKMAESPMKLGETDPKKINKKKFQTDLANNKTQSYLDNNEVSSRDAKRVGDFFRGTLKETDLSTSLQKGLQAAKIEGTKKTLKQYPRVVVKKSSRGVKNKGK